MRELHDHKINPFNEDSVKVNAVDGPGPGGASHVYQVDIQLAKGAILDAACEIKFQRGPVNEAGVNGITDQALLAILIDRLRGFQGSEYNCRENACALTHLEEAMMWQRQRTINRARRGVEGTSEV